MNYTYDNANRLTQITQGTATVSIGYDNANRRTSLTLPNGIVTAYGYDTASRLTSITSLPSRLLIVSESKRKNEDDSVAPVAEN